MAIISCVRGLQTAVVGSRLHHEPAPAINVLFFWHLNTVLLMLSCCLIILLSFSYLSFSVSLRVLQNKLLGGCRRCGNVR